MPKKKPSRSNKKKNGGKVKPKAKTKAGCSSNNNRTSKKVSYGGEFHKIPNFHETSKDGGKDLDCNGTMSPYQMYKQASLHIKNEFMKLLPKKFRLQSVNDLARASDYIFDQSIQFSNDILQRNLTAPNNDTNGDRDGQIHSYLNSMTQEEYTKIVNTLLIVPKRLIENTETSLRLRSQVMEKYIVKGTHDKGHKHIMKILIYCRKVLKSSRMETKKVRKILSDNLHLKRTTAATVGTGVDGKKGKGEKDKDTHDVDESTKNQYKALMDFDDDEEEDDEQKIDTEIDIETAEEIKAEKRDMIDIIKKRKEGIETAPINDKETDIFTIEEDLIKGDDRMQACAFLYTMEMLMSLVSQHYRMLKKSVWTTQCTDPKMLMQCAMVANNCMRSVQIAEASLALDHPHLSTFYSVLAVVFLPIIIHGIESNIPIGVSNNNTADADTRRRYTNSNRPKIIELLGNVVETSFHNKGAWDKYNSLIRTFCKKTGYPFKEIDKWCKIAKTITDLEIQSNMEANMEQNRWVHQLYQDNFIKAAISPSSISHQWFSEKNHVFIGGNRSLLNTQRWLQTVLNISNNNTKLTPVGGFFGKLWNESTYLAESFQGDLDELYCGAILPELIEWCKPVKGMTPLDMVSHYTPETLPVLDMLRSHLKKNKFDPVPASLSFGMHCILTSIIELQGNNDVNQHAINAQKSWDMLFDQLVEQINKDTPNDEAYYFHVSMFSQLRSIAKPLGQPCTSCSPRLAFFNPLMAGSYLLFANYVVGIGLGSRTVDSIGQLRIVLHLYNALKQSNLLGDSIPLLEEINSVFKDTKSIWVFEGDHPIPGQFCKRFLMSWGFTPQSATDAVNHFKRSGGSALGSNRPQKGWRDIPQILPDQFSKSYRLFIKKDFTGVNADYSIRNYTTGQKTEHELFITTLSNINMTRDAMDEDEDFVCFTNWTQIGCILNRFIRVLMKELESDHNIQKDILNASDLAQHAANDSNQYQKGKFQSIDEMEFQICSKLVTYGILFDVDQKQNSDLACKAAEFMKTYFTSIKQESYSFYIDDAPKFPVKKKPQEACNIVDMLGAMSIRDLKHMASKYGLDISTCVEKKEIVDKISASLNHANMYIEGTDVKRSTAMGPNPVDFSLEHPPERDGSPNAPLVSYTVLRYCKSGEHMARLIKPGKLTPLTIESSFDSTPRQLVKLDNGKYRHIGSFTLDELRKLKWDGAMYNSHSVGTWVPFIEGYDSDPDDSYEPFDRREAQQHGIIGLPVDEVDAWMILSDMSGSEEPRLVQLNR